MPAELAHPGTETSRRTRLCVLMFTDLVNSTGLKSELGTNQYLPLLQRHDELLRAAVAACGGQFQQDTGDGCFAIFSAASDAVKAALVFQWSMHSEPWPGNQKLAARVGIHSGEVAETDTRQDGGNKLVGVAVDLTARLMSLALGEQILLTRSAFDDARQFITSHPGSDSVALQYVAHGPYLLKGSEDAIDIYEVGVANQSPLSAPPDSEKARRALRPGDEQTLGWRPALSLPLPGNPLWLLTKKLGEGGFGEVWLARHTKVKDRVRVFKFCFDPDRLRALKREVVLFRLLKEALGNRRDIASVLEWRFEEAPYFIEMEFAPDGNLTDWAVSQGGIENIPLQSRLKIVNQIAKALSAAHSVGILHKDIKPSNVLMVRDVDGSFFPRLTDFGIGILTDRDRLKDFNITAAGFTESNLTFNDSSRSGTRMYTPPEGLQNKPHTVQGDVYALGVVLYQMVLGDLHRPLGVGWERNIADPLIREDIAACVDEDSARRLPSAAALSERLESSEQRRAEHVRRQREAETLRFARRRKLLTRVMAVVLTVMAGISVAFAMLWRESVHQRREAINGRTEAEQQKHNAILAGNAARAAEAAARHGLAANLVDRGLGFQTNGEPSVALLYFIRALELQSDDPAQSFNERIRIRAAFDQAQRPVRPLDREPRSGDATDPMHSLLAGDGRKLVIKGNEVDIVDRTGKPLMSLKHDTDVASASFSPGGARIVTASWDQTARVWDATNGQPITSPLLHAGPVLYASFSPDGSRVVTASWDQTARVWDSTTGEPITSPMKHENWVLYASFSPDGMRIVTASDDQSARVWDSTTGQPITPPLKHEYRITRAAFSSDGSQVITASDDHPPRVWDAAPRGPLDPFLKHEGDVTHAAFSADGRTIVTASQDKTARVWDAASGQPLTPPLRHDGAVYCAAFNIDATRIVTASQDNTARVWDALTGQPITPPLKHDKPVYQASFSSDGKHIVTASWDHTARVWDATTGAPLTPPMKHENWVLFASFSPDGTRIVTASDEPIARLWNASTGEPLPISLKHGGKVHYAAFSADGQHIVTASDDHSARIWNSTTGEPVTPPLKHDGEVHYAVFSPDGKRLITASADKTARVWDATTGQPLTPPLKHDGDVTRVTFSPDGSRVATAGDDNTARVWDAATGQPITPSLKHDANVTDVSFSPDGIHLVTAGYEKIARLWDISPAPQSAADLKARVEMTAVRRINETGGVLPLDPSEFQSRWKQATTMFPQDYFPPPTPQLADAAIATPELSPQLLIDLAGWFAHQNQPAGALKLFTAAKQRGATVDPATLARCAWRAGERETAATEFRRAIETDNVAERDHMKRCLAAVTADWTKAKPPATSPLK